MCNWISIEDRKPERPSTPFAPYLCWLRGIQGKTGDGIARVLKYSRELESFLPLDLGGLALTHWAAIEKPTVVHRSCGCKGGDDASACAVRGH